jgi:hypothetical protein
LGVFSFDIPVGSEFTKGAIVGVRRKINDVVNRLIGWRSFASVGGRANEKRFFRDSLFYRYYYSRAIRECPRQQEAIARALGALDSDRSRNYVCYAPAFEQNPAQRYLIR